MTWQGASNRAFVMEPVIRVTPILIPRSKGTNQSGNPHRWWNKGGDWKAGAAADKAKAD